MLQDLPEIEEVVDAGEATQSPGENTQVTH